MSRYLIETCPILWTTRNLISISMGYVLDRKLIKSLRIGQDQSDKP